MVKVIDVPGSYGLPVAGLVYHTAGFLWNWHEYFVKRQRTLRSNVFKTNFGMKAIALMDWQSLASVFDTGNIRKEYGFGPAIPQRALVGNEVPTAFTNDQEHQQQKQFCFQLLERYSPAITQTFDEVLDDYLQRWDQLKTFVWDDEIEAFWSDFLFQWVLDVRPRQGLVHIWIMNIFSSRAAAHPWSGFARSERAYTELIELVHSSPRFSEIAELALRIANLDENQTAKQLLFYLGFNAWGGLQGLAKSVLAELSLHPQIQSRIADEVSSSTTNEPHNLPLVRNTVYEVLRMHPPVFFVYGILKKDTVIESSTGTYRARRGERLVGNLWFAQRDATVFESPEELNPDRFQDTSRLKYLMWANGYGNDDSTPQNRMCAGKTTVYTLMSHLVAGVSGRTRWEVSADPYWSTRKFIPAGVPTNRLHVSHFEREA